MKKPVRVKDAMTKSPLTIGLEQPLDHAKKTLIGNGIRHLPVLEGGRLVGVVTDRDIKLAAAVEKDTSALKVSDVCVTEVYTTSPDDSLKDVVSYMAKQGIGSAVVVEREKVVGIFTTVDACRVLAELL